MTADDILNKSIEFCGGAKNISKIKSSNLVYDLTTGDGSKASVIIKRIVSQKYMRSFLSDKYMPISMLYDGSTLTSIDGNKKSN